MKFVKMHGCENDYLYLDGVRDDAVRARVEAGGQAWAGLVRRMSHRHRGVGSDGVIVLCPPTGAGSRAGAHVRMRMFNADGSESEMCGNGVRCVAKYAHDRLGIGAMPLMVETGRGVLAIEHRAVEGKVVEATVDMGEPVLDLTAVPVDERRVRALGKGHASGERTYALDGLEDAGLPGEGWVFVSMGNPHAVRVLPRDEGGDLLELARAWGPRVETLAAFPRRTNVHLVRPRDRSMADVATWERGSGITRACGTGACACLVAGVLVDVLDRSATMHVPGGELRIRWDERGGHVFMTGEAVEVCEGEWPD